jgi:hypothetical protein
MPFASKTEAAKSQSKIEGVAASNSTISKVAKCHKII